MTDRYTTQGWVTRIFDPDHQTTVTARAERGQQQPQTFTGPSSDDHILRESICAAHSTQVLGNLNA
nr:hypothetical protein [Flaviflexus salsibiostraticola]